MTALQQAHAVSSNLGRPDKKWPCAIDDLTDRGAGLRVGTVFGLPRVFLLTIDGETMSRHCRVIWSDGKKLGVSFE